jgi:hypothetical protein
LFAGGHGAELKLYGLRRLITCKKSCRLAYFSLSHYLLFVYLNKNVINYYGVNNLYNAFPRKMTKDQLHENTSKAKVKRQRQRQTDQLADEISPLATQPTRTSRQTILLILELTLEGTADQSGIYSAEILRAKQSQTPTVRRLGCNNTPCHPLPPPTFA